MFNKILFSIFSLEKKISSTERKYGIANRWDPCSERYREVLAAAKASQKQDLCKKSHREDMERKQLFNCRQKACKFGFIIVS